jgi:hypothetical protein
MFRTSHGGLSQENAGLDTDACLKNAEELTRSLSQECRGMKKKVYPKNVEELTGRLISRM